MKEYKNDDIIVYWLPELCAHPGTCLRLLPNVFNLNQRPWVNINAAEPDEIIRAIDQCPSGALRYALPEGSKVDAKLAGGVGNIHYEKSNQAVVKIGATKNGPLLVEGPAEVVGSDGQTLKTDGRMALCSCGRSKNSPFCDGSHRKSEQH